MPYSRSLAVAILTYLIGLAISALWLEPDADTRARMWTALQLNSRYEFMGESTIPSSLRARYNSAMKAASPELRSQLYSN